MGFDPANIQQVGVGVAAFILTIVSVFMFVTAPKEKVARALGTMTTVLAVWGWVSFASALTADIALARELRIISLLFETGAMMLTLRLARIYLSESREPAEWERDVSRLLQILGFVMLAVFVSDLFGTQIFVGPLTSMGPKTALAPHAGPWFAWYILYYASVIGAFALLMGRRLMREHGSKRTAGSMLSASIAIGYFMAMTGILPWYGIDNPLLGIPRALAVPFFAVAAFYSIVNYRLFNVRVAAAEIFIFAIWGFLFFRTLLHPSLAAALPDIMVLAAVIALGFLLIRNITNELAVRIKLEEVSRELSILNGSLESKVAERTDELVRAQQHIEQVVEHLPVGLIEIAADGMIVRMNDVAERLFGTAHTAAPGSRLEAHPELTAVFGETLAPGTFDAEIKAPQQRFIEVAVAPLSLPHGEGLIAIIRDVTDRHSLERAKDDFVATAAHQLRTPLAAIKWTFDLLKSGTLTREQQEIVARGASGIANMERIAEGLMMSIRTAEGITRYSFVPTKLSPLLEKCAALVDPLARKKQIIFSRDIAPQLPELMIDPARIESAIENLLDNAIKYTPTGGTVTFRGRVSGERVVLEVSDTGIGISEADKPHLFEKFFRARKATEMATDGSGLGLAIVKSIVEAHDGTISFVSEEGSGSTFAITLPIRGAA